VIVDPPGAGSRRLAVLGKPIAHSRSPQLQLAAYRELGLTDWTYERSEVDEAALPDFLASLDSSWRGLSLTMPLKEAVIPLLDELDQLATRTGAVNTVVLDDGGRRLGWNTDVGGIVRAFAERGVRPASVLLLGTGATARSTLAAFAELGVAKVLVAGRSADRVGEVVAVAEGWGVSAAAFEPGLDLTGLPPEIDLIASSLPREAEVGLPAAVPMGVSLFDVAYGVEPGPLTRAWRDAGESARIVSGLDLLVHQALLQVRLFTAGDLEQPLPDEAAVLRAMRAAVGGF